MNNVEAGRASAGRNQSITFHTSLILSQWHGATESSDQIYCYPLKVGVEYNNQKSRETS